MRMSLSFHLTTLYLGCFLGRDLVQATIHVQLSASAVKGKSHQASWVSIGIVAAVFPGTNKSRIFVSHLHGVGSFAIVRKPELAAECRDRLRHNLIERHLHDVDHVNA